ncbi:MAG: tetratricopeptide repeat protein [Candidatus Eremiobacteraeota bacterium]|nr:tetratricopeptide repeat protein [Candidatus Eremiobacteraeota bacterium]
MFTFLRRFARDQSPRGIALAALARGAFSEAEERLAALLADANAPADRAFFQNKLGIARVGLGRRDEALEDFRGALASVESYPPALTNVGNLLLEDGAIDDAIAHYEAAIRSDDGYAVAHQNLGVALKRSGRIDEGVRALRRAGRLEGGIFGTPRKKR